LHFFWYFLPASHQNTVIFSVFRDGFPDKRQNIVGFRMSGFGNYLILHELNK